MNYKILINNTQIDYLNVSVSIKKSIERTNLVGLSSIKIFKDDKKYVEQLFNDYLNHYELQVLNTHNNKLLIKGYIGFLNAGNSFNCDYLDLEIIIKDNFEYLEQVLDRPINNICDTEIFKLVPFKLSSVPNERMALIYLVLLYLLGQEIHRYLEAMIATINAIATNPLNAGMVLSIIYYLANLTITIIAVIKYINELYLNLIGNIYYTSCIDIRVAISNFLDKFDITYLHDIEKDLFVAIPIDTFGYHVNVPTMRNLIDTIETLYNRKFVIEKFGTQYYAYFVDLNDIKYKFNNGTITKFNYDSSQPYEYNYHIKTIKYSYDESDLNSLNNNIKTQLNFYFTDNTANTLLQKDLQKVLFKEIPFSVAKRKGKLSFYEQQFVNLLNILNSAFKAFESTFNTLIAGVNQAIKALNKIIKFLNKVLKINMKEIDTIGTIKIKTIPTEIEILENCFLTESNCFTKGKLFYGVFSKTIDNNEVYVLKENSVEKLNLENFIDYHKYQTIYKKYEFKTVICDKDIEELPKYVVLNGANNAITELELDLNTGLCTGYFVNKLNQAVAKKIS